MEGDIITLQDVFIFDYSAGFDENGKFQGAAAIDGPAPALPRAAHRPRRPRRPRRLHARADAAMRPPHPARPLRALAGCPRCCWRTVGRARTPTTRSASTTSRPPAAASSMLLVRRRPPGGRDRRPRHASTVDRRRRRRRGDGQDRRRGRDRAHRPCSCSTPATAWKATSSTPPGRRRRLPRRCTRRRRDRPGDLRRQGVGRRSRRPPTTTAVVARARRRRAHAGHQRLRRHAAGASSCRRRGVALAPGALRRRRHRQRRPLSTVVDAARRTPASSSTSCRSARRPRDADELAGLADGHRRPGHPGRPRRARAPSSPPQADALAQQLLVTFDAPDGVTGEATVDVTRRRRRDDLHRLGLRLARRSRRLARPTSSSPARRWSARPVMLLGALGACLGLGRRSSAVAHRWRAEHVVRSDRRLDAYFDAGQSAGRRSAARQRKAQPTSRAPPSR